MAEQMWLTAERRRRPQRSADRLRVATETEKLGSFSRSSTVFTCNMSTYMSQCHYGLHVSVATTSPRVHERGSFHQMFAEDRVRLLFNLIQMLFHHLTLLCFYDGGFFFLPPSPSLFVSLSLSLRAILHFVSPTHTHL